VPVGKAVIISHQSCTSIKAIVSLRDERNEEIPDRLARKDDCNSTPVKKSNVPINILVQESPRTAVLHVIHITCCQKHFLTLSSVKKPSHNLSHGRHRTKQQRGRPNATRARGHPQLSISSRLFIGSTTTKAWTLSTKCLQLPLGSSVPLKDSLFHASSHHSPRLSLSTEPWLSMTPSWRLLPPSRAETALLPSSCSIRAWLSIFKVGETFCLQQTSLKKALQLYTMAVNILEKGFGWRRSQPSCVSCRG
jgi:hypothetical protein